MLLQLPSLGAVLDKQPGMLDQSRNLVGNIEVFTHGACKYFD